MDKVTRELHHYWLMLDVQALRTTLQTAVPQDSPTIHNVIAESMLELDVCVHVIKDLQEIRWSFSPI